ADQRLAGVRAGDDAAVAAQRPDRERPANQRHQRRRSGTPLTIITTEVARSDSSWLARPATLIRRRSGTLAGRNPRPISVVTTTTGVGERYSRSARLATSSRSSPSLLLSVASRRLDSQTVSRSRTTAPLPSRVAGS